MAEVADNCDCTLADEIHDGTVLLESGLDSLGFAILVARLEEELGRDPFTEMEDVVYPRTLGEFVSIYER
jgi:acyl carrier protein